MPVADPAFVFAIVYPPDVHALVVKVWVAPEFGHSQNILLIPVPKLPPTAKLDEM